MARWNEYERRSWDDRDPRRGADERHARPAEHDRGYGPWDPRQYGYGTDARDEGPDVRRHGAEYRRRDAQGREYGGEPRGWSADDQDWGHSSTDHRERYDRGPRGVEYELGPRRDPSPRTDPNHRGRGPRGYVRSDERIREDVCERLMEGPVDVGDVEVTVSNGEVTLSGTVVERWEKRAIEDIAGNVRGVHDVHNRVRVRPREARQTKPMGQEASRPRDEQPKEQRDDEQPYMGS